MMRLFWLSLAVIALLAGCVNLAPDYQRPEAPVPEQWLPATAPEPAASAGMPTDIEWQDFFIDKRLVRLQTLALTNNRDLRVAALNVEKAQAQYRIERAASLPTIDASGSGTRTHTPASTSATGRSSTTNEYSAQLGLSSYKLDVFGRIKNLQDEALEDYLALTETRRSTQISLIAEVATGWLTLAADNQLLKLAQDTLTSQQQSYDLTLRSHGLGGSSGLEVAQAQTTVESARGDVAQYRSQVLQDRNALRLLVGSEIPDELLPGAEMQTVAQWVQVPAELPSSLLQRRPDVLSAEHSLKSANIDIGAARAAFFPSITLTASAGSSSTSLSGLFKSRTGAWSFAPGISVPIFDGGSNRATLDSAKIESKIQIATYQQTIQTAFKEVADALAVRSTLDERVAAQQAYTDASRKRYELADALYRGGSQSYLEALESQRSLYAAEQDLISLRLTEQSNRVTLYKVMGGGWNR
ncbi:Outer membrane protein [Pseudomonas cannabina]|uniref:Outer membrane protein n=2 Tax=Pseudomonas cannabina TaxID=86840 RepID=A0A0P9N9K4_PSECA|nr:Outer membrane protein [Pseudomonas cannabina]RMN40510.1 Outer membrane protein [Pseudomonas cannabina]SDQ87403.1 outer membrane protein, multidrug efflux system [Pseudomonas cannabina]